MMREKTLSDVVYQGVLLGMVPMVGILMQKGASTVLDVIKYKMTTPKPAIINQEAYPKYGRMDRMRRWWAGYKTPPTIFDSAIKERLARIEEKTKNIKEHIRKGDKSATYTNLLLYGPPGTGKTLFARVLADYADMDFLPTSGALLTQTPVLFNELVEMANRSSYGTIIFIDEADDLFLKRTTLLQSGSPDALATQRALNHIMGTIGQRNNKFMVIAATNLPQVMDEAMERRFPNAIEMPLPDLPTRLELLNLYIANELFNEKNNSKEFVTTARALLTPQFVKNLAVQLEGFSHSKIGSLIIAIKDATRGTKTGMITQKEVNDAVEEALRKHTQFKTYQMGATSPA
jgi:ATPase family AAA domain-containing protein 3A/B